MQTSTRWYHLLAYFFAGAFLANTVPHLVNGMSGSPFQSPFARPPGEGLSSASVNVLWGFFNLVVAYILGGPHRSVRNMAETETRLLFLGLRLSAHGSYNAWHGVFASTIVTTFNRRR